MTNLPVIRYVTTSIVTNVATSPVTMTIERSFDKPILPVKPHALYDGVCAVTWMLAFLVFSKGLLNVRNTIRK